MKALSIKQPWAWAIMNAGKDIENRDWSTNFRGTVAIHASKGMTQTEYGDAWNAMYYDINTELMDLIPEPWELVKGAIVGTVEIVDCVSESKSEWFFGNYGFVLKNPRKLIEPIYCKGALGFWEVPKEIETQFIYA